MCVCMSTICVWLCVWLCATALRVCAVRMQCSAAVHVVALHGVFNCSHQNHARYSSRPCTPPPGYS